jgi:hypothetical protein
MVNEQQTSAPITFSPHPYADGVIITPARRSTLRAGLRAMLRELLVFALFVAASIILTWPLARLLPSAVVDPGDPLINTYIVSWVSHALATDPARVFHPTVLYPATYVLALSENMFGLWPLAAVLLSFFSPLATHNVLLLAGFAFSAYGGYVLARLLTRSVPAGLVAGVVYGFCAWRFMHLSHLQFAWGGWLPLLLAAFVHFDRRPTSRSAALVAGAFLLNGLTNLHYLVFSGALCGIAILGLWLSSHERRAARYITLLAASLILPALILLLLLWPYRTAQQLYSTRGNVDETLRYSATLSDWANRPGVEEPERRIFPGVVTLLAGVAGIISLSRRGSEERLWGGIAIALVFTGVLLSLGLHLSLYRLLFEHALLLSGIRAPARWAVLAYLGLSLLAALALRNRRFVIATLLLLLFVAETSRVPIRWYLMPPRPDAVYEWLRDHKVQGAVLELPIGDRDVYYLPGATIHHKPTFNGMRGGSPVHSELKELFSADVIASRAFSRLRELGASTIVVHSDALGANAQEIRRWLAEGLARRTLSYEGRFEAGLSGDFVFSLGSASQRGAARDDVLAAFLANTGTLPPNQKPFGYLESPLPGQVANGGLEVRGWALSGSGVQTVRAWFANRKCFADASLGPYDGLQKHAPFHATASARFSISLPARPCGGVENDILIEIIDHAGERTTLPHVWFRWE